MISFALDILKAVVLTITTSRITDNKAKAVRAYVALHDKIERVERVSEELLADFRAYLDSNDKGIDPSRLRRRIRDFSAAVCDFAEEFRVAQLSLRLFSADLSGTIKTIVAHKLDISRSLLEVTAPAICVDKSAPWEEQHYVLRVLDYEKFGKAAADVQKHWSATVAVPLSDLRTTPSETHAMVVGAPRWVNVTKHSGGEDTIAASFGFKHLSFDDRDELAAGVADGMARLNELHAARTSLEEFLASHFTVADFF